MVSNNTGTNIDLTILFFLFGKGWARDFYMQSGLQTYQ